MGTAGLGMLLPLTTTPSTTPLPRENSSNILDNLLSRMEQYANNLEELVEESRMDRKKSGVRKQLKVW